MLKEPPRIRRLGSTPQKTRILPGGAWKAEAVCRGESLKSFPTRFEDERKLQLQQDLEEKPGAEKQTLIGSSGPVGSLDVVSVELRETHLHSARGKV